MYAVDVCVIARNSRRTMKMVRKIQDVSPAKTALICILLFVSLAAGLSAQGQSPQTADPTANTIARGSVSVANGVM